jgi:hypothetical protein
MMSAFYSHLDSLDQHCSFCGAHRGDPCRGLRNARRKCAPHKPRLERAARQEHLYYRQYLDKPLGLGELRRLEAGCASIWRAQILRTVILCLEDCREHQCQRPWPSRVKEESGYSIRHIARIWDSWQKGGLRLVWNKYFNRMEARGWKAL